MARCSPASEKPRGFAGQWPDDVTERIDHGKTWNMTPPSDDRTFDLLLELVKEGRDVGFGKEEALPVGAKKWVKERLAHRLQLPALEPRTERTATALGVFAYRLGKNNTRWLYSTDMARLLCHAIFGAHLRFSFAVAASAPPRARRFLLLGETGSGKERIADLMARTLVALEGAAVPTEALPYDTVNAAALTDSLAVSELFGSRRGAFTGADRDRKGIVDELGEGGVLFLDEVADAPAPVQADLLRFVHSGHYRAVGSTKSDTARVHVIAATNRSEADLRNGVGFRKDLFYRLAQPPITLPPFRDSLECEDPKRVFGSLVEHVLAEEVLGTKTFPQELGDFQGRVVEGLIRHTKGYRWPGNLRECTNLIAQIWYQGVEELPRLCASLGVPARQGQSETPDSRSPKKLQDELHALEWQRYQSAWQRNPTVQAVARELGVSRQTASRRLAFFRLKPTPP